MITTSQQHKDYCREYYQQHREAMLDKRKEWYANTVNKQRAKQYKIKSYTLRHDHYLSKQQHYNYHYNEACFIYALDVFGEHKCAWCGETDLTCLQFDHKNGNGVEHRTKVATHTTFTLWIIKHPKLARKELQVLCASCNWRKLWRNRENLWKHSKRNGRSGKPVKPLSNGGKHNAF